VQKRRMSHRYTLAYRRATLGDGAETTADASFEEHVIGQFPVEMSQGEKDEFWKRRGEEELRLLERNSR
jgi:hypothetical protein